MRNVKVLFLIILPIILIVSGLSLKSEIGYYHLLSTDPVYAYIFDGLNICNFTFPFLVQGPGTPLTLISAGTMEIVHLFRQHDTLIVDVIKNPEVYLSASNTTITLLQGLFLFLMGFWIYKTTKNIFISTFLQLTPFVSWIFIDLMRPIMVENLILIGVLCLIALVIKFVNDDSNNTTKIVDKYVVLFSIIIGFIAATKLMYLPIAIIPFLLLSGLRKKCAYIILSIIAFSIFAFPIFNRWVTFRSYYVDNFMHSGVYGNGPKTIVDINTFIPNLTNIFTGSKLYLITLFILLLGAILYFVPVLKVKKKDDKEFKTLTGIVITMVIMTLLVAKQFKFYYLTIALLLIIPGLYFLYSIYFRNLSKNIRIIIIVTSVLLISYNCYSEVKMRLSWIPGNIAKKENYLQTYKYVQKTYAQDQPTLLIADYYGAPYKEYGLFYGMAWCRGDMRDKYATELKKLYPNIYIYHGWNNLFNQWDNSFSFIELLKKYNKIVLFSGDSKVEADLNSKLHGINRQLDTKFIKKTYFESTKETFYDVSFDSIIGTKPYSYFFNAEYTDSSKQHFVNQNGITIENGNNQSVDYAKSGKFSTKITKDNPYGFTSVISEVSKDEHFKISVWKYNNGNSNAGLVVAANDVNKFYLFQTNTIKEENNWQKLEVDFIVSESVINHDIKVYVWNNDVALPAYFDDLLIEKQ
jgi:hypothetical protein